MVREVIGFCGKYYVDENGVVYCADGSTPKKPRVKSNGYLTVQLYKDGRYKQCYVHRIVAQTFISNPCKLPEINHKDENKANNSVDNLEWCTHEYNMAYGTREARRVAIQSDLTAFRAATKRRVLRISNSGDTVCEYESIADAAKQNGINSRGIQGCCSGRYKTSGGYIWEYSI